MSACEFYEGRLAVRVDATTSMTVEEMHAHMDFDLLETSHTFIQWLFPTDQMSRFNAHSAILTADDARRIANNLCMTLRVSESFVVMLEFFGFGISNGSLVKCDDERLHHLVRNAHNRMRISRILRSLVLLGFNYYAKAFFEALSHEVYHGILFPCRTSCDTFWRMCAYGESPHGFPESNCLVAFKRFEARRQIGHLCAIVRSVRCLGAHKALQRLCKTSCFVVGVASPKQVCLLAPSRMRLVVVNNLRRRVVSLRQLGVVAEGDDATIGFLVYKAVRKTCAYGGEDALCTLPFTHMSEKSHAR